MIVSVSFERMIFESPNRQVGWTEWCERPSARTVIVFLLLLAVPILSTLARDSWYLSSSDPGHYLLTASKMKVVPTPILSSQELLQPVVALVPVQTETRTARHSDIQEDPEPSFCLAAPIQTHRRPPPVSNS
jgi:hypothetical protein